MGAQSPTDASIPEAVFYARQLRLPGFSPDTQARLRAARVLIVGVGGLGCPAALYLAAAGVGVLGLCDADVVSATNLHRQVLFDVASVGQLKVEAAARRLRGLNPHIRVETLAAWADETVLREQLPLYDIVIDGTDNFAAKFAINDACAAAGVALVYGSIYQFEGQVSVFHRATDTGEAGYSYRDLFDAAPPPNLTQNCGEAGVLGVLPGIIGTLQAAEAIKLITGLGSTLAGQLLTFDALSATTHKLALSRRSPRSDDARRQAADEATAEISYAELRLRMTSATPPTLLDVREAPERQLVSLGGTLVPLGSLHRHLPSIARDRDIVVYCQAGMRSAKAALYLRSVLPGVSVINLKGGVDAALGSGLHCA